MSNGLVILLVFENEEESDVAIAHQLALDGYTVRKADCPAALEACCASSDVQLVILGQAVDAVEGFGVLRALRARELAPHIDPGMRVLWLCKTSELVEVLRAFAAGADDAIRAPVAYDELLARARALLRRHPIEDDVRPIRCGALRIDPSTREVTFRLTPVSLRRLEYELLVYLARDPHRVHTKQSLLQNVWGFRSQGTTRTVDSHASRLRRKLALAGAEGWVRSVWGVGLRLAPDAHSELRVIPGGLAA